MTSQPIYRHITRANSGQKVTIEFFNGGDVVMTTGELNGSTYLPKTVEKWTDEGYTAYTGAYTKNDGTHVPACSDNYSVKPAPQLEDYADAETIAMLGGTESKITKARRLLAEVDAEKKLFSKVSAVSAEKRAQERAWGGASHREALARAEKAELELKIAQQAAEKAEQERKKAAEAKTHNENFVRGLQMNMMLAAAASMPVKYAPHGFVPPFGAVISPSAAVAISDIQRGQLLNQPAVSPAAIMLHRSW